MPIFVFLFFCFCFLSFSLFFSVLFKSFFEKRLFRSASKTNQRQRQNKPMGLDCCRSAVFFWWSDAPSKTRHVPLPGAACLLNIKRAVDAAAACEFARTRTLIRFSLFSGAGRRAVIPLCRYSTLNTCAQILAHKTIYMSMCVRFINQNELDSFRTYTRLIPCTINSHN